VKVRYCTAKCGAGAVPIGEEDKQGRCPKCHGALGSEVPAKLNFFRFYGFATDEEEMLKKTYGPRPFAIPFTFPGHPALFITVGRECYQGKFLHCCNHWEWDSQRAVWADGGKASRRVEDTMQRREMDCHPDKCPFVIGTEDKAIKPGQCGEVVVSNLWLYELDGWDLVRFKSGGINTINNFQDAVRKLLVLTQGLGSKSLKLELRIRSKATKYPTPTGFKSTTINEVYIHWPNNPAQLAKALTAGDLKETDVYVVLPDLSKRLALPEKGAEPENTFDELIDGPRQMERHADPPEPLKISDLPGRTDPVPVQAEEGVGDSQLELINDIMNEYITGDNRKDRKVQELLKAKKAAGYKGPVDKMNQRQATAVITWLQNRKRQVIESAAKDAEDNAKVMGDPE
jgi:hypothetical protein